MFLVSSIQFLFRFGWQLIFCTLYSGGLDTRYNEYDVEEASELNLDASKSTVVYVHGWNENVNNSETLPKIVNSFLQRNEHNVCVLDFKDLAESYYKIMVDNVPQVC